jgi:hypothetical protein
MVRFKRERGESEEILKPVEDAADRFERDNEAAVRARAAANVYDQSKAGECLSNLSRDPENLNKELGLDPGTFTREDFENANTGYRAALYKSGSNGRYILSFAGTDPNALSDWQTNIDNGAGEDTKQYNAARQLAQKLHAQGVDFDITGHSKGGGMATDAGLVTPGAGIWTFNSAGLNPKAADIAGEGDFQDVAARTEAYHTDGDFLTALQTEKDPARQIQNATALRNRLAGADSIPHPLKVTQSTPDGGDVPPEERRQFLDKLDKMIADAKVKAKGENLDLFPKALGNPHTLGQGWTPSGPGKDLQPLIRHTMDGKGWVSGVMGDLESQKKQDSGRLEKFAN